MAKKAVKNAKAETKNQVVAEEKAVVVEKKKEEVPAVEVKAEEVKTEETKVEKAPKTAKNPVKTEKAPKAEKEVKAEKETKKPAKKEDKAVEVFIQYQGGEVSEADVIEKIQAQYVADGHRLASIKSFKLYVKPEENAAYYVINEKITGKVTLF